MLRAIIVKTGKVSLLALVVTATAYMVGCHGGALDASGSDRSNGQDPVIGVWELFGLGASFQGPWWLCAEAGCSGTWTMKTGIAPLGRR